jgi:hypothetical protein
MKQLSSPSVFAAAVLALGTLGAAGAAHARSDVTFSVGIQPAQVYVQPAPVLVQPRPVFVQPATVYVQPRPVLVQPAPYHVQPRPVYVQPGPPPASDRRHWGTRHGDPRDAYGGGYRDHRPGAYGGYRDGAGYYAHDGRGGHPSRHARRYGPYGDLDRDGILNKDDRDRDGDGVRNRHDRFPDDPNWR